MTRVSVPRTVAPLLARIGAIAAQRGAAAYAVGGCVRDWLLRLPKTLDVDVAVEGGAIELARAVRAALGGDLVVHEQFGTATLAAPGRGAGRRRIDFAMCRTERYERPGAYPKVAPGTIAQDLFRRDFTINAMAVALSPDRLGELIDPYGGQGDLTRKRLRILHPNSFLDDPSRMLRGIRFAERFGLRWAPETDRARREAISRGALGWLNPGRVEKELTRMAAEPDPRACLRTLARCMTGA